MDMTQFSGSPAHWEHAYQYAGLTNIMLEEYQDYTKKVSYSKIIKDMGDYQILLGSLGSMLKLAFKSKKIRKKPHLPRRPA